LLAQAGGELLDVVGTTVTLMANSPALSPPPVEDEVVPDTTCTVQVLDVALNPAPVRVTVVEVESELASLVTGVDPDRMLVIV